MILSKVDLSKKSTSFFFAFSNKWKLAPTFEFTERATPQQNSLAEKAFDTITSRSHSQIHAAHLNEVNKYKLFKESHKCACLTDGLTVLTLNGKTQTRFEHWSGKLPAFAQHLRTWGEAGVISTRDLKTPKIHDKGITCMFVGYSLKHAGDCYRMWDPLTSRIHMSRDIKWLDRMYFSNQPSTLNKGDFQVGKSDGPAKTKISAKLSAPNIISNVEMPEDNDDEISINIDSDNSSTTTSSKTSPETSDTDVCSVHKDNENETDTDKSDTEEVETDSGEWQTVTKSGRKCFTPKLLMHESINPAFSNDETNYYSALRDLNEFDESEEAQLAGSQISHEICSVGAGVGDGFKDTS